MEHKYDLVSLVEHALDDASARISDIKKTTESIADRQQNIMNQVYTLDERTKWLMRAATLSSAAGIYQFVKEFAPSIIHAAGTLGS